MARLSRYYKVYETIILDTDYHLSLLADRLCTNGSPRAE